MVDVRYKKAEVYDELTEEYGLFKYYYQVMLFLAVLGYREDTIETNDYIDDESSFGLERFTDRGRYHAIITCLAFQKTGDSSAMADDKIKRDAVAQYAAGGLKVYEREFGHIAGDPTDAIANYIKSCTTGGTEPDDGVLQTIIQSFDDEGLGS
jgi:dnd system-associated protein 4